MISFIARKKESRKNSAKKEYMIGNLGVTFVFGGMKYLQGGQHFLVFFFFRNCASDHQGTKSVNARKEGKKMTTGMANMSSKNKANETNVCIFLLFFNVTTTNELNFVVVVATVFLLSHNSTSCTDMVEMKFAPYDELNDFRVFVSKHKRDHGILHHTREG